MRFLRKYILRNMHSTLAGYVLNLNTPHIFSTKGEKIETDLRSVQKFESFFFYGVLSSQNNGELAVNQRYDKAKVLSEPNITYQVIFHQSSCYDQVIYSVYITFRSKRSSIKV